MAYKALIFGAYSNHKKLKPLYDAEVKRGNLEIVDVVNKMEGGCIDDTNFDLAIISSKRDFYSRMKELESMGIPRDKIIDGRVFSVHDLDFSRLLKEKIAYGSIDKEFESNSPIIYPRRLSAGKAGVELGVKSYINRATIERSGIVSVGNFSAISWGITFEFSLSRNHNYRSVTAYSFVMMDWAVSRKFFPPYGEQRIEIGNDV